MRKPIFILYMLSFAFISCSSPISEESTYDKSKVKIINNFAFYEVKRIANIFPICEEELNFNHTTSSLLGFLKSAIESKTNKNLNQSLFNKI